MMRVLFARVGWMRWYKGPHIDDAKPIGGGKYNQDSIGHEAFNFQQLNGQVFGYFQPKISPVAARKTHESSIALERIQKGFEDDVIDDVLTIFVATHPILGGQRIVGWFRSSTVHRYAQSSKEKKRQCFHYFIEASAKDAVLVPEGRREFMIPGGVGAFGQANVCYTLDSQGHPKEKADWISEALEYISSYALENVVQDPASETDTNIVETLDSTLEGAAGFQSNPRIRRAIEDYAMRWAERHLKKLNHAPRDTHKNKPYDFVCVINRGEVFVEVKGMQDTGKAIALTPREVKHAQEHKNSALFIVHSVIVKGKQKPVVSGGKALFLFPWDISTGTLKPRSYVFTLGA